MTMIYASDGTRTLRELVSWDHGLPGIQVRRKEGAYVLTQNPASFGRDSSDQKCTDSAGRILEETNSAKCSHEVWKS